MKTIYFFIVLGLFLPMATRPARADGGQPPNFISVTTAKVLVITHQQLLTPNWVPGMAGAWETELLAQKTSQGFTVALWAIQDNLDQTDIKDYLETYQGSFKFVYILGDVHRPENDPPTAPIALPQSNYTDGNFVRIWRELVDTYWRDGNGKIVGIF